MPQMKRVADIDHAIATSLVIDEAILADSTRQAGRS